MAGFTMVPVSGRYLDPATGNPRAGTVTFTLGAALANGGATSPTTYTATLDSGGWFSTQLPATNDLGTTPAGQVYHVVESLNGGAAGSSYALPVTTANLRDGITLGAVVALGQPAAKVTVAGARSSNAALGSLITALASLGLITDNTTT